MFRISKSRWDSRSGFFIEYDKIEHFLGGFVLFVILWSLLNHGTFTAFMGVVLSITFWEIKDAYVPWEKYGFWGGEGFCWKDWVSTVAGALLGVLIDTVLK